jgi:tetratricopeptide (TPR) repeat protein
MKPFGWIWISFLIISMLSGCATAPQQVSQAAESEAPAVESGPELPNIELTADLLNQLFVAEVALQRGHYDTAVTYYSRLAEETQDPRLLERATRIAIFARDYQTALKLGKQWLKLDPANLDGGQMLTALLLKAGDYDAALESLENVLQAAAGNEKARYLMMIRLLGREQDKEGALEVMQRFLERHPDDESALYAYAQLALRAGKVDEAEKTVDKLLEQKPDWPQAVVLRTRIMQVTNREAASLEYLGDVVKRNPKEMDLRIAYGRMLADVDRPEEALEQFRKVLKAEPENDDILFVAGLVALRVDKIDEAEGYFLNLNDRAVRPDETGYYLGRIAEAREDYHKAIHWYSTVSNGENYLNAQIRSALLHARQGDVDAARALLHAAQAHSPGQKLRLYMAEGEILRDVGHFEEALAVYDDALKEVPGNIELLYARAMVAEKLDRLDVVEHDLHAILEREPDHVDALNSLGYTLADKTDRIDEAYRYIKRALELKPDSTYVLDSMGWVLYRQGKLDEALDYLRRAIDASNDAEIAAHLGEVLWVKGDHKAARNIWKKALEQTPESSAVLNTIKRLEK